MVLQLLRESFLAKKKRTQPDDSLNLVLQGVRIYDPPSGTLQDNGALFDIFIANGRIESIEPAADKDKEKGRQPRSGRRVEGGGKVVMPGLCDAHVHVTACSADLPGLLSLPESLVAIRAEKVLEGMLLRGFTTVRDAGGADFGLAQAVEEGIILGPRLLFTGHALSQVGVRYFPLVELLFLYCVCGALPDLHTRRRRVMSPHPTARIDLTPGVSRLQP